MKTEILIIDDSHEIGEALQVIIEILGFECKYFDSPKKAISYFQNELNPLIFLDIYLPNDNGLDLLPVIKNINPFTQVIMMSGEGDIHSVVTSLKNKAFDFLLKPFSVDSVKIAIERGIEYYTLLKKNFDYQENLERDMKFISIIQKQIVSPKLNSDIVYADFHAFSFVSGCFYYLEEIENKTCITFGEIEGNGVTSSFIGLLTVYILKNIYKQEKTPDRILSNLNNELYYKINIHTLTAVCLVYDKTTQTLSYSSGGGTIPILINKNETNFRYLESEISNIIGVMPGSEFVANEVKVSSDSLLFLYNTGFLPIEENSKLDFENFILEIQLLNNQNKSFEETKKKLDEYVAKNLKTHPEKNLSFLLQKF